MKTPRWFTRNHLSYLRIPAAVTLIVAAAGIAFVAASPDPPNTRLTNDDPALSGYTSDYTLVTGIPYTDPVLTACPVSGGRPIRVTPCWRGTTTDACSPARRVRPIQKSRLRPPATSGWRPTKIRPARAARR